MQLCVFMNPPGTHKNRHMKISACSDLLCKMLAERGSGIINLKYKLSQTRRFNIYLFSKLAFKSSELLGFFLAAFILYKAL